jgi:hypothetical protein
MARIGRAFPAKLIAPRRSARVAQAAPTLTAGVDQITATSARPYVSATWAGAATLYWIIQPAATADPSAAQVASGLDGSGGAAFKTGSETSPTSGTSTVYEATPPTGLTASASYESFWVWDDGVTYSAVSKAAFTTGTDASVTLTGATSTVSAGTLTAIGAAIATITGAGTNSAAGTLTAFGATSATATLTGASATASAGAVSASATVSATASLTGASSTSSAGTASATGAATAALTGATTATNAGAVLATAGGSATAALVGASTTASPGTLTATGSATAALSGAGATASAGTITASNAQNASVTLTGASVSATAGALAATGAAQIMLTGASVTASAGTVTAVGTGASAGAAELWGYTLSNGLTAEETLVAILECCQTGRMSRIEKLLRNKQITDPVTGLQTVYDDDGSTVLMEGDLFEDAAGTQPYRGQGAERRERLA